MLAEIFSINARLFHPNEKVLGWVKGCKEKKPMPIEEITDDMD